MRPIFGDMNEASANAAMVCMEKYSLEADPIKLEIRNINTQILVLKINIFFDKTKHNEFEEMIKQLNKEKKILQKRLEPIERIINTYKSMAPIINIDSSRRSGQ